MAYIATNAESYKSQVVGSGHCVPFVQKATGAPLTSLWKKGAAVKGNSTIAKGTAIATFGASGKYENKTDGTSHAAVYLSQDATGILVLDQWLGRPVGERRIRFNHPNPEASAVNRGEMFYVVD